MRKTVFCPGQGPWGLPPLPLPEKVPSVSQATGSCSGRILVRFRVWSVQGLAPCCTVSWGPFLASWVCKYLHLV